MAQCTDPRVAKLILAKAPDSIVKGISNAALNALRGDVHLSKAQKRRLAANRRLINLLVDKEVPLSRKRRGLVQSGGTLQLIPILLSAVLSSLGSTLFNR